MNFLESEVDRLKTEVDCLIVLAEQRGQESYEARKSKSDLVITLYRLIDLNPHEMGRTIDKIMPDEIALMLRGWKAMGGK